MEGQTSLLVNNPYIVRHNKSINYGTYLSHTRYDLQRLSQSC